LVGFVPEHVPMFQELYTFNLKLFVLILYTIYILYIFFIKYKIYNIGTVGTGKKPHLTSKVYKNPNQKTTKKLVQMSEHRK